MPRKHGIGSGDCTGAVDERCPRDRSMVVIFCCQSCPYPIAHSQEAPLEDAGDDPRDDIDKAAYAKAAHGTPDRGSPGEISKAH